MQAFSVEVLYTSVQRDIWDQALPLASLVNSCSRALASIGMLKSSHSQDDSFIGKQLWLRAVEALNDDVTCSPKRGIWGPRGK
jgi:hypothetical protein